jgi:cell division initiation protein
MTVSPNDIRNYEFPVQMRGYSREEVDAFLDQVAASLEAARQENLKLSMELDSVRSQLAALKEFEDSIKNAAIDARRNADMTVARAKKEAEQTLAQAKAKAENLVSSQRQELADIDARIAKAEETKQNYLRKMRTLIESHLEIIEDLAKNLPSPERPELPKAKHPEDDTIVVTKSSEVSREKMETVANEPEEAESSAAEEVNAASKIVEIGKGDAPPAGETDATPSEGGVDPELQAALKSYQTGVDIDLSGETEGAADEKTGKVEVAPLEGMVSTAQESQVRAAATGKVKTQAPKTPPSGTEGDAPIDPEKLAEELDSVVAKFEEEMDKAAQS